jgi:heme A synthase
LSFTRYGWGVLVYNLLVILWGAYVRATGSGAGCGSHWPLCNGAVVPRAPRAETIIEFTHRLTSGVALLSVVALAVWAFRRFPPKHPVRRFAGASVGLILVEALLGAGLVLFRYVADNASIGRAIYLSAHLVNTLLLLGAITLTTWWAGAGRKAVRGQWSGPLAAGFAATLLLGVSGAVVALGDTLSAQGIRQDSLAWLRVLHPAMAVIVCAYLALLAWTAAKRFGVATPARRLGILIGVQLAAGLINVLLLAPVWMQLAHLALADLMWIAQVLLAAEVGQIHKLVPAG